MKILTILMVSLTSCFYSSAQVEQILYQGTINNRPITLYLKQETNACGGENEFLYQAIYRYGTGKNWIELAVVSDGKGHFSMTEFAFTGVMVLKRTGETMQGTWISPDGKTHLKIILRRQALSPRQKAEMEENLDRTHYQNYDC